MSGLTRRLVLASVCLLVLGFATHLHLQAASMSMANRNFGNQPIGTTSAGSVKTQPVTFSPSSLNFGNVGVGTTSTTTTPITLHNNQNTPLTGISLSFSGDFNLYSNTTTCGTSVPAGGQCQIAISFTPTQLGPRSGTLTITDSASTSPQTVNLTGTGTAASLKSISVTTQNSTLPIGVTQQFTATGTFPMGITLGLTSRVTWKSSVSTVASISNTAPNQGLATSLKAGTTAISATLNGISGSILLTVVAGKVTPTVSWTTPAPITYGTALSATQLNATASVPGTFAYTPAAGAVLNAGSQTLSAIFTPTDTTHWNSATASVTLVVNKAAPVFSGLSASQTIAFGTASISLSGAIAAGSVFPPSGETVSITINGATVSSAISGNGSFTTMFPTGSIPVSATPYVITYSYAGDGNFTSASDTSTTLTVVNGVFKNIGNLDIVNHTSTLLNNGTVLIAGGYATSNRQLVVPQIYNPVAGTFTPTSTMNTPRDSPTATLLNNGTVLIVGGCCDSSGNPLTSAEIYDPGSATFTLTGSMNIARQYHKATLLNNGMVLITGGISGQYGSPPTNIAELYDPAAGTFTEIASPMVAARWNFTSTLLNNGTVLIAGGQDANFSNLSSAELYDPVAGTFSATANMTDTRSYHTATLLNDGTVLVAGGANNTSGFLASAELYTPTGLASGTFTSTGSMINQHYFHRATLLNDGTVLVTGGCCPISSAELYDPNSGGFSSTGNMNTARYDFRATRLNNGTVLVTGGWTNGPTTAELYTSSTLTPPNLVSIAVTPASATLPVAQAMKHFIAVGTFNNNNTSYTQQLASVTWSSTDSSGTNVAQITNDATNSGVAEGVSLGKATITACAGTICGSATLTIVKALTYTQLTPSTSPSPGCCFGMAFDPVSSSTLLFGGVQAPIYPYYTYSPLGDTWQLRGGQWSKLFPSNVPSPREGPAMAFDAATNTIVLFGGSSTLFGSCCGDLNDTWIWSGVTSTWAQVFPLVSPPARRFDGGQGMAYDANTKTVVMFGGSTQAGTNPTDTWTWNGVTLTWTQQLPATSPPGGGGMATDPAGNVVLFNGANSTTWVWTGTTWTLQSPATTPYAPNTGMAYDTDLNEVVLYGGASSSDTWTWDGTDWTQVFPTNVPHDRYAYPMVYDGAAHAVVIFGGFSSGPALNDTWELAPAP